MTRSEILAAAAATVAAGAQERKPQSEAQLPALLGLRYVVPIGPFRVGVLDSAGVAVIEHPEAAPTRLNLPRATPEVYRWVRTGPPSTPYIHPAQTVGDVIRGAEPDEVTVAVAIMPYVILGVATFAEELPRARMPSFLIRIIPSTLELDTYALPPDIKGDAAAVYRTGDRLVVVNYRGESVSVPF